MVRCRLRRTFKGPTDGPRSKPAQPAQRARSSRQAKTLRLGSEIGDRVTGRKDRPSPTGNPLAFASFSKLIAQGHVLEAIDKRKSYKCDLRSCGKYVQRRRRRPAIVDGHDKT